MKIYELAIQLFYPTIWRVINEIKDKEYYQLQYIDTNTIYYKEVIIEISFANEVKSQGRLICTYKGKKYIISELLNLSFGERLMEIMFADNKILYE